MGFTEMLFLCRGWTWKKVWLTAMADRATDRSNYIAPIGAAIEKIC